MNNTGRRLGRPLCIALALLVAVGPSAFAQSSAPPGSAGAGSSGTEAGTPGAGSAEPPVYTLPRTETSATPGATPYDTSTWPIVTPRGKGHDRGAGARMGVGTGGKKSQSTSSKVVRSRGATGAKRPATAHRGSGRKRPHIRAPRRR